MKKILKVDNPNVYAEYVGAPVLHPQLALISYDEVSPFRGSLNNYGVYGLYCSRARADRRSRRQWHAAVHQRLGAAMVSGTVSTRKPVFLLFRYELAPDGAQGMGANLLSAGHDEKGNAGEPGLSSAP